MPSMMSKGVQQASPMLSVTLALHPMAGLVDTDSHADVFLHFREESGTFQ